MDNTIYVVLGLLFVVYLFITVYNKRQSGRRRDRKFMEGYGKKSRDSKKENEKEL